MKGDRWTCPVCKHSILEADCVYASAICRRTVKCRTRGGTNMTCTPAGQTAYVR